MGDWRHLTEKEIDLLIRKEADSKLIRWADYHLKKEGHFCKKCKKLMTEKPE